MRQFFTKGRVALLISDALTIPTLVGCKHLADYLLATSNSTCLWTKFGGQCLTCGGTHFVGALLGFRFEEAFHYNELLFLITILLAVSCLLLHITVFARAPFAKAILRKLYSIPSLIITIAVSFVFLLLRNMPVITYIIQALT